MNNYPFKTLRPMFFELIEKGEARAYAIIEGNNDNPHLWGIMFFYEVPKSGVLVEVEVTGLPDTPSGFHGMHIHENGNCTPPFDMTGNHYNPANTPHPKHAGDMPPLLSNGGYAYSVFYTNRFDIADILGKSLIIHSHADDFTTQPSGNSGEKIGCGVIMRLG